uniref:WD_REPEATS_REGION domain-containing protein n=1 Tax=Macrostomum lignano TaxID=282301 RepID=A0A1I8IZX3_9PLAT
RSCFLWFTKDWSVRKAVSSVKVPLQLDHGSRVAFSPDSKAFIVNLYNSRSLAVYKLARSTDDPGRKTPLTVSHLSEFQHQDPGDPASCFASTGGFVMTCYSDTRIKLWSRRGDHLATIDTCHMTNCMAAVSPCGRFVASCGFTPDVKVWEVSLDKSGSGLSGPPARAFELKGHNAQVDGLAFSADSTRMATASKDTTWKLWNIDVRYKLGEDPKLLVTGRFRRDGLCRIALSPDARCVAIATGASVTVYSCLDASQLAQFSGLHQGAGVSRALFHPRAQFLVTCGSDRHMPVLLNVPGARPPSRDCAAKAKSTQSRAQREMFEQELAPRPAPSWPATALPRGRQPAEVPHLRCHGNNVCLSPAPDCQGHELNFYYYYSVCHRVERLECVRDSDWAFGRTMEAAEDLPAETAAPASRQTPHQRQLSGQQRRRQPGRNPTLERLLQPSAREMSRSEQLLDKMRSLKLRIQRHAVQTNCGNVSVADWPPPPDVLLAHASPPPPVQRATPTSPTFASTDNGGRHPSIQQFEKSVQQSQLAQLIEVISVPSEPPLPPCLTSSPNRQQRQQAVRKQVCFIDPKQNRLLMPQHLSAAAASSSEAPSESLTTASQKQRRSPPPPRQTPSPPPPPPASGASGGSSCRRGSLCNACHHSFDLCDADVPGPSDGSSMPPPPPPPKDVSFDENGQTWDVYGADIDPDLLGQAIQTHLTAARCSGISAEAISSKTSAADAAPAAASLDSPDSLNSQKRPQTSAVSLLCCAGGRS